MKGFKIIMTVVCLIAFGLSGFAQERITVTGTVLDKDALPVIGASVMVKGTTQGVPTDLDGKYSITVSSDAVLEFSYIGYTTIQESVNGRTSISVVLSEDNNYLESVVVVGYGTQKKGSVIGSVAGVGSDDILTTKSENPQNMLTGKIPGLRVWQKSAEPGTYSASFDIRGMGAPLVIIDGVPRSVEEFQRLNASDIENVSVLKDASAAIYGVRAGNGVLLVTTKTGAEGKAKVNYSGSFTFQTPSKMPALTDVYDAMTLWNEKNMNTVTGGSFIFKEQDYQAYRNGEKLTSDWNALIMAKMSPQTQHDLSVSGGTEKIQYYLSFGYLYQEGFFKSRDLWYDKYNIRSNITAEIIRGMKLNLNLSGLIDQRHTPYTSSVEIIRNYWSQGVVNPAYADKEQTMLNYAGLDLDKNTVAMMTSDVSGYNLYNQKYFQSSASLEYDFGELAAVLEGLNAKALFGYDFKYNHHESFRKEYYLYAWSDLENAYVSKIYNGSTPNNLSQASYNFQQTLAQFIVNYDRTFDEKHKVGALLGYEMQKRTANNHYASGDLAFGTPYFTSLSGENQMVGIDKGAFYEVMYQAMIGRVNYSFADRYLIEAQFRYDGSSKFAPGHQWGFFPSVSAGWRISEEPFFKNSSLSFINQLKVRASYGVLGDDNSMNYEWISGYTYMGGETSENGWYDKYAPGYIFNGNFVYSVEPSSLPNVNITWLRSTTFNIGLDFEAWRGKLGATLDYFHRKRTGIFSRNSAGLPTIIGASAPLENLDSDSHFGLELELYHRNKCGDFTYEVKGMASITRQKHLIGSQNGKYGNSYEKWRNDNLNNRYQGIQFGYEGIGRYENWEDIWSYDIYKENNILPGDYKYLDWNGDGEINGYDAHPIAFDQTPWLNYSLSFNCAWKGIDFNILFQGSALGSMKYSEPLYNIWGSTGGGTLVQYLDRWRPADFTESTDIYDPSLKWIPGYYGFTGHYPDENSSFNRVSTAYLRLKSIEIGYTLPKFKKAQSFGVRVYANAYNPFTITGVKFVDPEHPDSDLGRMYPLNKTYTIGLSISF